MSRGISEFPDAVVVATEVEVSQAYERIVAELQPVVSSSDCVLLGVMMGGMIPMAQICGLLTGDFAMDYCQVSRDRGGPRRGELEWLQPPHSDLAGRTVLLVDDIFDEGLTLEYVVGACQELGAARVISTVLVRKIHDRTAGRSMPDLVGLTVDDRYVFGCGMDYQHRWRHLPAIYAVQEDE